jgi:L-lysine exporter family protein LysE/ArgO
MKADISESPFIVNRSLRRMRPVSSTTAFAQGWLMMAGLIVAIGAQNALVLRQGLARAHVAPVVLLCILSDWLLVAAGVLGLGALIAQTALLLQAMRWLGAAFVLWCALQAARRAWRGSAGLVGGSALQGRAAALWSAAALTWLNPHVYLDTVVLLGAAGAQHAGAERLPFATGAGLASLMWFTLLGFGAAALAPWFARPRTWRIVDGAIALVMLAVALQLATA